jgi:N utilization substance protein B
MLKDDIDYEDDKKIILKIYSTQIIFSEELYQNLEEQSIFWNDDVEFTVSMILKTIRRFTKDSGPDVPLMSMYRNEEDKEFVERLFRRAIAGGDEYLNLIGKYTKNWEIERIAFMDILVMQLCIAEIVEFEDIPTKVSFNEYLEISKYYSTHKSSYFINGILDKVIHELKMEKIIVKKGRGLVGEETENGDTV